jgi:hypothetical protein
MHIFQKKLTHTKEWDRAVLYVKGQPQFSLDKNTEIEYDEDVMKIKPKKLDEAIQVGPDEWVLPLYTIIHMDEIVRIDFFQLTDAKRIISQHPGLIDTSGTPLTK